MTQLDSDQLTAVESDHHNIVVIAGPGSGKTGTLIHRILRLIQCGVTPASIVVITYTNAASHEIQTRLGSEVALGYAGTLHSLILRYLQLFGEHVGFSGRVSVMDKERREQLIEQCIEEMGYKGSDKSLKAAFKIGPPPRGRRLEGAESVVFHFYEQLLTNNVVDYDAILHLGKRLLLTHGWPDCPYVHLFVDEMQDAGHVDDAIYRALPIPNRFIVGDPRQAIFAFRDGDPAWLIKWSKQDDVESLVLENNYRSAEPICAAAMKLIKQGPEIVPVFDRDGEVVIIGDVPAESHEIHGIAKDIQESGINHSECAVLCRTNHLAQQFAQGLKGYGIAVAKKHFEERPGDWKAAKTLIALLVNPDNDMLAHWFLLQRDGEQVANSMKLRALQMMRSINELTLHLPKDLTPAQSLQWLAERHLSQESLALVHRCFGQLQGDSTLADLALLVSQVDNHSHEYGDGVTVTTLHSAKGREWHTVYLPAFEQGIIPLKGEDIDEERRLAFVGLTRAKTRAVFSWCLERQKQWGPVERMTPSQFLSDLQ